VSVEFPCAWCSSVLFNGKGEFTGIDNKSAATLTCWHEGRCAVQDSGLEPTELSCTRSADEVIWQVFSFVSQSKVGTSSLAHYR
jgi:hypothetical protein